MSCFRSTCHVLATTVAVAFSALLLPSGLKQADGHEGEHGQTAYSPLVHYQPTPRPDRIILTLNGDPATSVGITWRTDTSVREAVAQYCKAPRTGNRDDSMQGSIDVPAQAESLESDSGTSHYHSVTLRDLKPATKYVYRVGDGVHWSEWLQFSTASDQAEPFTFIYFGDAQNAVRAHWSRVIREAHRDAPKAAFMLHAGDLINRANRDVEWGEWFEAGGWLNGMLPSIATPGNHEYASGQVSRHWRPQFAFPTNGLQGLEETVFYLDYQGVRFVSLNSNERGRLQEQAEWLDQVLADNPHPWTILTYHHPLFSTARGRDNPDLREVWKPIIDKHSVDLVLQGHDHSYGRTGLKVPQNLAAGANVMSGDTVYVVSVSGPKMYPFEERPFFVRGASNAQLYQIIHIAGKKLHYEARVATGELYDAFTLDKTSSEKKLTERVPDTPPLR